MMSVTAIAVAPTLGFVMYQHGWKLLCAEIALMNLAMAIIAETGLDMTQFSTAARLVSCRRHTPPRRVRLLCVARRP